MTSELYATIVALVLLACWRWSRHDPAAPGPDSEELSGVRQGDNPPNGAVVSGPPSTWLESAPADDRAFDLSNDNNDSVSSLSRRVVVGSTVAGAPTVHIYRWVRPAEGKRLEPFGWWLEHVDPRYGTWLIRKEERW